MIGFNAQNSSNPYGYAEPNGVQLTRQLGPGMLRFPGGTVGNFYDWRNDRYYDLPPEVAARHKGPAMWQASLDANRGGHVGFDDFISLCRASDAEPVLMVNLYTPVDLTPDELAAEAAAWVYHVNVERGLGVKYWELGNEYYVKAYRFRYTGTGTESGRDPAEYLAVAEKTAAAMRTVDPSITLSVIATSPDVSSPGSTNGGETEADEGWNEVIATGDFYDAVVMHPYVITTNSPYANVPPGTAGLGTGDWEAEARWLFSATENQPRRIHEYVQVTFGAGTDVWYTEQAVLNPTIGDSMLGALHDADMVLQTADYPETFRIFLQQNLTAPGGLYIYQYCSDAAGNPTTQILRSPAYHVFEQLDAAINGASGVVPVRLNNAPTFEGRFQYADSVIEGLTIRAWTMPDGRTVAAVVNKLAEPQSLQLAGQGAKPRGDISQTVITSPLEAQNTCAAPDTVAPVVRTVTRRGDQKIELPPYSFSMITI